ncbi:LysR family transcriptional regulator [Stagnihabitans tardus]|uniref:LysR family transcriptional regulator n=1 Tax=Stagnihabitans tardus TaxID=2699202 RepID=A0AAE4YH11_9RHOB|nr:LysR family transcriptional regulator [Stagnihabitans tardus]NBZ89845.1 LysR family transcriptional regulator [Stagnihabitans tardus]
MKRETLPDLAVFLAVVEAKGFTQAAARLGTSQSAVSLAVRRLEEALGVRLLNRTTRKVAPTLAGERLAQGLSPAFTEIDAQVAALSSFREGPSGLVRINCPSHAAETALWPRLSPLVAKYPDLELELTVEQRFSDIVTDRHDAGVRLGESIDQDMIAVRIGPDMRMTVVGSPDYFARAGKPLHPRDLVGHACINLRLDTRGDLYVWEFAREGQALNVRVTGALTFNSSALCLAAALDGHGLALLPEDRTDALVAEGRLARALEDWSPVFAGYHLYYPSRRQISPALQLVIDHLRWKGPR